MSRNMNQGWFCFFLSFVLCPSLPLFIDRVSCSPGWFLTYYVSKADFELLILKLLIGKCLGYRCVSPCPSLVLFLKGKQQLLSRMPGFSEIRAHLYPVETVTMTYVPLLICFVIQKVTKRGRGRKVWEVMDRWLDMFVGKAGGASLNPHMYQEPQEDPWQFTCQPAYLKQQSLANPCMCTHMHLCTYTCMYNRHPTK